MIKDFLATLKHYCMSLYYCVISIDPGLWRLRLAVKTVAVCWLILILARPHLDPVGLAMVEVSTVLVFLCTQGATRRAQMLTMLCAGGVIALGLPLGVSVQAMPWLANTVLVALCFGAFYVRRFGPRFQVFPVMGVLMYLLGTVLPIAHLGWTVGFQVCTALLAMIMFGWVWPGRPHAQARHHLLMIFYRYWKVVAKSAVALQQHKPGEYFANLLQRFLRIEMALKKQPVLAAHDTLLTLLYAEFRVLELLVDNVRHLSETNREAWAHLEPQVLELLLALEALLFEVQQVWMRRRSTVSGVERVMAARQALLAKLFVPNQPMVYGLIFYSNLLFASQRVGDLTLTMLPQLLGEVKS